MIEAGVGGIGACCGHYVADIINASSPFSNGLVAGIDRQADAFLSKEVIQLLDAWCVGLVDKWVVDIANGSSGFNAGESVDGKDLLESEGSDNQALVTGLRQ